MEIYSDNEFKPESARFCIVVTFFCIVSFQLGDIFSAHSFYAEYYCIVGLLVMCFFPLFSFSDIGFNFLKSRVERGVILLSYLFLCLTISLLSSVIVKSKNVFDVNFYMFCFLVLSLVMGAGIGAFFSDKNTVFNANENIVIRGNEIELRKIDIFGILSLKKMPFLRAPLIKVRNTLYILAFFIGTGGVGLSMGIVEILKLSEVISPEVDVYSVLYFILGVPVLFTFGVITYSMMMYLLEWKRLVKSIDSEYGEHKIIFNSKKKSYKKIKEILDMENLV